MSVAVAVGAYCAVHALGVYLLRASDTWKVLFSRSIDLTPDKTSDPLRAAPRGWIENHSFWDLANAKPESTDDEQIFWGNHKRKVG